MLMCACGSTASIFALNRKNDLARGKPVQLAGETLRSSLKITSAFARHFVLDGHREEGICSHNGKL